MTIKQVAQMAGVSPAAVSRYLNGGPVSEKKKRSIEAAIKATGYRPNAMARTMRTGRGSQIGVIAAKIDSESTAQILSGITGRLSERDYTVMLGVAGGLTEQEIRYIGLMQEKQIAGIILMGTVMTPALHAAMEESAKPIVVTGQNFDGYCCIYHQDYEAVHELMQRMLDRGRSRIGYIGVLEEDAAAGRARLHGAQDAWEEEMGDAPLATVTADGFDAQDGEAAMSQLLRMSPDIDGVICATDLLAIGAMGAARRAGKEIPGDIAFAGVGDCWADTTTAPPLTSAHLFYRECGQQAADMLLEMIEGGVAEVTNAGNAGSRDKGAEETGTDGAGGRDKGTEEAGIGNAGGPDKESGAEAAGSPDKGAPCSSHTDTGTAGRMEVAGEGRAKKPASRQLGYDIIERDSM